jgi:hypothetical protein
VMLVCDGVTPLKLSTRGCQHAAVRVLVTAPAHFSRSSKNSNPKGSYLQPAGQSVCQQHEPGGHFKWLSAKIYVARGSRRHFGQLSQRDDRLAVASQLALPPNKQAAAEWDVGVHHVRSRGILANPSSYVVPEPTTRGSSLWRKFLPRDHANDFCCTACPQICFST